MAKSPNLQHAGVKRLMSECREFQRESQVEFSAAPCEDNLFEWHFTIRGPVGTDYEGGIYHGRILMPAEYPMKPPDIMLLTPSGRFETNKKICLSITGFHPKDWQPSWGVRTMLVALQAFFPTPAESAIGSLESSAAERKQFAKLSVNHFCTICGKKNEDMLTATPESLAREENRPTDQQELGEERPAGEHWAEVRNSESGGEAMVRTLESGPEGLRRRSEPSQTASERAAFVAVAEKKIDRSMMVIVFVGCLIFFLLLRRAFR